MACGDKAPPGHLTELVEMQNPEKPGTWFWSPQLARKQGDHAPVPKHPINLPSILWTARTGSGSRRSFARVIT